MLLSSFELSNGTIFTPLAQFCMKLGLACTSFFGFFEYTPVKNFNDIVQSGVKACREGLQFPNSSVAAESMKLVAKNSYDYENFNRCRHSVAMYVKDENTHAAQNTQE